MPGPPGATAARQAESAHGEPGPAPGAAGAGAASILTGSMRARTALSGLPRKRSDGRAASAATRRTGLTPVPVRGRPCADCPSCARRRCCPAATSTPSQRLGNGRRLRQPQAGRLRGVLEHRRNGWYLLGGGMIAAGTAWLASWGAAVGSASPPRSLQYWVPASYGAVGLIIAGFLAVFAVMYDLPARLRRRGEAPQGNRSTATSVTGMPQIDPADWIATCDESGDHLALVFTLRRSLGEPRCHPGIQRVPVHGHRPGRSGPGSPRPASRSS